MTFDAKENQRPYDKHIDIMMQRPEQPAKCAAGQATAA